MKSFRRGLIAGLFAVVAGVAVDELTGGHHLGQTPLEKISSSQPHVFATAQTKAFLNRIGLPGEILAQKAGKDVLFVRPEDLEGDPDMDMFLTASGEVTMPPVTAQLRLRNQDFQAVYNAFNARNPGLITVDPAVAGDANEDYTSLQQTVVLGGPAASFPGVAPNGHKGCMITLLLPEDIKMSDIFAMSTGLKHSDLNPDIQGTSTEILKIFSLHEDGHCRQLKSDHDLRAEINADRSALTDIKGKGQESRQAEPPLIDSFKAMREMPLSSEEAGSLDTYIAAMNNSSAMLKTVPVHATFPFLRNIDGPVLIGSDPLENTEYRGMMKTNAMIDLAVGLTNQKQREPSQAAIRLLSSGTAPASKKDNARVKALIHEGGRAAGQNPILAYAALRALYENGYFSQGSPESRYAERIISLYDRYASQIRTKPEYQKAHDLVKALPAPSPGV